MSRNNAFQRFLNAILIAAASLCFASCATILYGVHLPRAGQKQIDLGMDDEVMLNTSYRDSLKVRFPNHPRLKDMRQPLQLWLYRGDTLIYATANCYARPGLRNLHWNLEKDAPSPIPVVAGPDFWSHFFLISRSSMGGRDKAYSDYQAIVVWSRLWGGKTGASFAL